MYQYTAQTAADGWAAVTTAHRVTKHTQAVAEIRRGDNKTGHSSATERNRYYTAHACSFFSLCQYHYYYIHAVIQWVNL